MKRPGGKTTRGWPILVLFLACFCRFRNNWPKPVHVYKKNDMLNLSCKETESGTCIKGLFWPPLEPKTENCFSPISFNWFIRRITEV